MSKVTSIYDYGKKIYGFFLERQELTYAIEIENIYKKSLLLAAASYFEKNITETIIDFAREKSNQNKQLVALIEGKTLKRQYHTLFSWDSNSTNSFFALFGEEAKIGAKAAIQSRGLQESEKDFLDLGNRRNILVHDNFASSIITLTLDEIYAKYQSAKLFVEFIEVFMRQDFKEKNE